VLGLEPEIDTDHWAMFRMPAGYELLGDIHHIDDMNDAFRHFRGPDGRVRGLNQQLT